MLKRALFCITAFLLNLSLYAQECDSLLLSELKDSIEFQNGIVEDWIYFSCDTTFYLLTDSSIVTPYRYRFPVQILHDSTNVYIFEASQEPTQNFDFVGFLISKLNINSGSEVWTTYNTWYTNEQEHELFIFKPMSFLENDEILILGLKEVPHIVATLPLLSAFGGRANPLMYKINRSDGRIIEKAFSPDTTEWSLRRKLPAGNHLTFEAKSHEGYNFIYSGPVHRDDGLRFFTLDHQLEFTDTIPSYSINIESPYEVEHKHFISVPVRQLSKDRLLAFFPQITNEFFPNDSTHLLQMVWVNRDGLDNYSVEKRLNLDEYFKLDYRLDNYTIRTLDENVIIQQDYNHEGKHQYWLLWLDKDGETKCYLPHYIPSDQSYDRPMEVIYVDDEYLYGLCRVANQNVSYRDLVRINSSDQSLEVLQRFQLDKNNLRYALHEARIINKEKLLFIGWLNTYDDEEELNNDTRQIYNCHIMFDLDSLGIDFITSTKDQEFEAQQDDFELNLYPNPGQDQLNIVSSGPLKINQIDIVNLSGQLIRRMDRLNTSSYQIDITGFTSGIYIIQILSNNQSFTRKLIIP